MRTAFGPHPIVSERPRGLALAGLALILAITPAGCGDDTGAGATGATAVAAFKNQAVTGRATLTGGKPLTKGRIALFPLQEPTMPLYGDIKPDGSFTLAAGGIGTVISHGDFQVSIEPPGYVPGSKPKKPILFPAKYLDPTTSELKVTITPETKQLPTIELK
jgi:hypothetical protein